MPNLLLLSQGKSIIRIQLYSDLMVSKHQQKQILLVLILVYILIGLPALAILILNVDFYLAFSSALSSYILIGTANIVIQIIFSDRLNTNLEIL